MSVINLRKRGEKNPELNSKQSFNDDHSQQMGLCWMLVFTGGSLKSAHIRLSPSSSPPPLLLLLPSEVRECLKLDPDHKQCFSHYKQVKKLNKQIQSAEEFITEER